MMSLIVPVGDTLFAVENEEVTQFAQVPANTGQQLTALLRQALVIAACDGSRIYQKVMVRLPSLNLMCRL